MKKTAYLLPFVIVVLIALTSSGTPAMPPPADVGPPASPATAAPPTAETAGTAATAETAIAEPGQIEIDIDDAGNDRVVMGEDVTITPGEVLDGDLVVTGGNVTVDGTVKGDVVCTGGNLLLGAKAVVEGDAVVVGGTMTIAPTAVVKGEKVTMAGDFGGLKYLKFLKGIDDEATALAGRVASVVKEIVFFAFLMFLALLMNVFLPRQFGNVREHLESDFPRSALLGVAAMVILPIAFVVLAVSIIGIPVIPLAFIAAVLAALAGYICFGRIIGNRLVGEKHVMLQVFVGLLLLQGASLLGDLIALPGGVMDDIGGVFRTIGRIIFFAGAFIGIGAVAYSRAGAWTLEKTRAARDAKKNGNGVEPAEKPGDAAPPKP